MKAFLRELSRQFPDLGVSQNALHLRPAREILVGYVVEFPPSGPRVMAYRFPLYVLGERLTLNFTETVGDFLPSGEPLRLGTPTDVAMQALSGLSAWRQSREARERLVAGVANVIRQHKPQLVGMQSLEKFSGMLERRIGDAMLRDPLVAKTYALTLLMLGDLTRARAVLESLSQVTWRTADAAEDFRQSLASLGSGPQSVREYRLRVMRTMRERLQVQV